jgi:hypothetical protein
MRHFISAALLFMVCAAVAQTVDFATTAPSKKSELVPSIYYSDTISDVKIQILSESTKMIDLSPDALSQEVSTTLPAVKFFPSSVSDYWPAFDSAPSLLFALLGM